VVFRTSFLKEAILIDSAGWVLSFISMVEGFMQMQDTKKKFCKYQIHRNIAIDMGLTKTEIFTDKQNRLAQMMKALAHPARIAIIQYLVKSQACVCGDLVNELGLAQATISQHLKELKNTGLIQGTIEGTSVCYCIDPKVWKQYKDAFDSFFVAYKNKDSCC
jgi:DNA-binding transcriptional ArsR family regulator